MITRILLVEDNPNNTRLIEQIIEDIDDSIELIEASDGETAIRLAQEGNFHLVLMDISLPDMDGITITKKIKELANFKDTPFIAVTAYAMEQDKDNFREVFNDYISKPIDDEVFTEKVKKWTNREK